MKKKRPFPPNRVRVLRAEHRLSQWDVAAELECGHNRLWRIENSFQEPTTAEMAKLAKLFKVPAAEIFPAMKKQEAVA